MRRNIWNYINSPRSTILVETDNLTIIRQIQKLCPHAKIIVTAESIERALKMYAEGADYVILPRLLAADRIKEMIHIMLENQNILSKKIITNEIQTLKERDEVIK